MWDIVINVVSDFIFIILVLLVVWVLNGLVYHRRLGRAQQFFGFHQQAPIRIYVSGFEHSGVKTKRVVNAIEYEIAVKTKRALQQVSEGGVIHKVLDFMSRLIGGEFRFPEPDIEVSPLEQVRQAPYQNSMILIGGPVSNQVSKFYLQGSPYFRFDGRSEKYQKRIKDGYQNIEPSHDVAVIEKKIVEDQIVILVHGFGEEQTQRAAQHLIAHWDKLYKQYKTQEFGILV